MLNPLRLAIVGTGGAGLACAIAPAQRGHSVVTSKSTTSSRRSCRHLDAAHLMRGLDALGCVDAFLAVSSPSHKLQVHNHRNQRRTNLSYVRQKFAYGVTAQAEFEV